ncbi:Uu.00g087460.m01.CDS01 [Anthostomella pinea]|uniref:Uu.00g087460.m01.CDS01 n=1 Tax=Anthostomella pinea TaxID=933095 RepID=A0AAI8YJZ6_9PEZI|nr:Uu.00g087460.m01.CDS01 [Anthostomella pinea]
MTLSCYASWVSDTGTMYPASTYSPGLFCAAGMTTGTSLELYNGVFCCPSTS